MSTCLHHMDTALARLEQRLPGFSGGGLSCIRLIHHIAPRFRLFLELELKKYGLTETVWFALLAIFSADNGEMLPSELSATLDLTRTSATRLSDELLAKGWITRAADDVDRRKIVLRLTPAGEALIHKIGPALLQERLDFCTAFAPQELADLEQILRRLIHRLDDQIQEKIQASL